MNYFLFFILFFVKYFGVLLKGVAEEELNELNKYIKLSVNILRGIVLGIFLGVLFGGFMFYILIGIVCIYSVLFYLHKDVWMIFLDYFSAGLMIVFISITVPKFLIFSSIFGIIFMLNYTIYKFNLKEDLIYFGFFTFNFIFLLF